ncbi:sacsin [Entomortierella parvispora]|uniref:Sacsin n=1 Tax=Entomortierella parvispora TaxID=205924 RepID=A0A9P3H821_9FUNG|nr:sacsin [Entomortierella parvispora]
MASIDNDRRRGRGGKSFRVKVSLTGSIKQVLDDYPDGAQIARELLQNSEDAGSTIQWYLLDHRSHPSQSVYCEGMEEYMGPALLAGNDSLFKERDYASLQNFGNSGKKTDYEKIGQMGIGFNSVYHMTDCPSFLSHDQFVILEPHENVLRDGGIREDFVFEQGLDHYADQIRPFTAMDDTLDLSKPYNGTIFRLPLRTHAQATTSLVSNRAYSTQQARDMLMMLKEDALECLLFLKHIERIQIYERTDENPEPVLLFGIEIVNAEEIRAERTKFMDRLKSYSDNSSTTQSSGLALDSSIRPEFRITDEDGNITLVTWQVTSMLGDMEEARQQVEKRFKCDTKGHRLIPWVGIASPVDPSVKIRDPRLFCFLPIGYSTLFPVHINGHFAVKPSRREIWTNQGNDISEQSNARIKAHWNDYMMTELVPKVYARFLENMDLDHGVDYSLWPEPSNERIIPLFQGMLDRVLTEAIKEKRKIFFMGPPASERSMALEDCNIADQVLRLSTLLVDILHQMTNVVVGLPGSTLATVRTVTENLGLQAQFFNPAHVRQCLLQHVDLLSEVSSSAAKSQTLEYCSRDRNVEALEGLPLLPLADGTWTKFSKDAKESCFLVSEQEYEILDFSNAGIIRLNEPSFPYWIIQDENYSIFLTQGMPSSTFIQKIRESFSSHYDNGTDDFPTDKWLSQLWGYLETRKSLIPKLEGLHLFRITGNKLASLDKANPVMAFEEKSSQTAPILRETLDIMDRQLGCTVLNEGQPGPISLAEDYLTMITDVPGVLLTLYSIPLSKISALSQDHRKVLSQYIQHHLSPDVRLRMEQIASLRKLPIFCCYKGTELESVDELAIVHGNTRYICKDFSSSDLPWMPSGITLFRQGQDLETVLQKVLNVPVMDESMYWIHIFLHLSKMPEAEWDLVIHAFARKYQSHWAHASFIWMLPSMKFVSVKGPGQETQSKRICPKQVVSSALEKMYLQDEVRFPKGIYAEEPVLTMLQSLGMTTGFNETLAKERILTISDRYAKGDVDINAATALFVQIQRLCSEQTLSQDLINVILRCRWIPASSSTTSPGISLYMPKECRPAGDRVLLGDTMPIVDITFSSPTLILSLGWNYRPPLEKVLQNLARLIETGSDISDIGQSQEDSLTAIYRELLQRIWAPNAVEMIKETVGSRKWILVNKRLYATDRVAFSMPSFLSPRSVQLPSTTTDPLFKAVGVPEFVEVNDLQGIIRELAAQYGEDMSLSEEDAMLVARIMEHIAINPPDSGEHGDLSKLLVLTQDSKLCRIDKVVYDDVNASQESSDIWTDSDEETYNLASSKISHHVATKLKITMLSTQYWHAKKDPDLEPWAQQEDIVNRIKTTLNDYDPSSIFKEFLQNAEDAGATKCVFRLDERSYGTQSILSPEMAACQGPALIIYNDAEFTKDDFRALCKLGVGNKRDDTTKIGRHGLGFNSAYHFTDVPSVVSGTHIGFFDPHRAYLPKSRTSKGLVAEGGVRVDFRKLKGPTYADQMAPYKGLFGCDMESHFKGTIFRFPLRTANRPVLPKTESSLGESAWTIGRIGNIMSDWHQDVKIAMLFLKNMKTIEFQGGSGPCIVTKSDITRGTALESVNARSPLGTATASLVRIQSNLGGEIRSGLHNWLVFQESQFPISCPASVVNLAKVNRWTPHRGTAFPLRRPEQSGESFKEQMQGRLFIHLPTPTRTDTKFHLHGEFALSSNRKGLAGGSVSTGDPRALWNEAMRKTLMPLHLVKAFAVLLEFTIAVSPKNTTHDLETVQAQYFPYLPALGTLEKEAILEESEFWKHTYNHSVFPCRGAGYQLVAKTAQESFFMDAQFLALSQEVQQKVVQLLVSSGKYICRCPPTTLKKIKKASTSQHREVTAALVRNCLSGRPNFLPTVITSAEGRSGLLEYILEDILNSDIDIYPSISNLAIIPLLNGEWKTPCSAEDMYYTVDPPMRALIEGDDYLIDMDLFNTPTLKSILKAFVKDERFDVEELESDPEKFASIFFKERDQSTLDDCIVDKVWSLLENYLDLSPFEELRIVKPLWGSFIRLGDVVFGLTLESNQLSDDILGLKRVLIDQDIDLIPQSSYHNHSWIEKRPCHPSNVLKALYQSNQWEHTYDLTTYTFTAEEANILRGWVLRLKLSAYIREFVGKLKIWESYNSDPEAPLISAVGHSFPVASGMADLSIFGSFPNIIKYPGYMDCSYTEILSRLSARPIHIKELLTDHIVPTLSFQPGGLTTRQKPAYRDIMVALWGNGFHNCAPGERTSFLSSSVLIPRRAGGGFAKGSDLLRPEDGLLQDFYSDESGMFPDETVWQGLRQLERGEAFGLQTSDDELTVRRCAEKLLDQIARLPINQRTLSATMTASIGSPRLYSLAVKLVKHIYVRSQSQENTPGITDWSDDKWAIVPVELTTDSIQRLCFPSGLQTFMAFSKLRYSRWSDKTWTVCAYFPADLEPPEHFKKVFPGVRGNANIVQCIQHLRNLVTKLAPVWTSKEQKTMLKIALFRSYQSFEDSINTIKDSIALCFEAGLKDVAFILNGDHLDPALPESWRKPSQLLLDIEYDIDDQQPVHQRLLAYRRFLVAVGVREIKKVEGHLVEVPPGRELGALEKKMTELFQQQDAKMGLMDVKFIFSDDSSVLGRTTKSILAHKFVLVHTCQHFSDSFTGAWSEFTTNDAEDPRLTVVDLSRAIATEAEYEVFWGVLYYLYTDKLIQTNGPASAATAPQEDKDTVGERVEYLVNLLTVADLYRLQRLKSLIAAALLPPSSFITHGNVFEVREFARNVGQNDLVAYCSAFIHENFALLVDRTKDEIRRCREEIGHIEEEEKVAQRSTVHNDEEEVEEEGEVFEDCAVSEEDKASEGTEKFEVVNKEKQHDPALLKRKRELMAELLNYTNNLIELIPISWN